MAFTKLFDTDNWQHSLKRGDVVAFRFPHERAAKEGEAPKVRPTLVLDVVEREGNCMAVLAYGTSSRRRRRSELLISISCPFELAASGLSRRTLFDGARVLLVPLDHPGFAISQILHTPVLGQLVGEAATRAEAVCVALRRRRKTLKVSLLRLHRTPTRKPSSKAAA